MKEGQDMMGLVEGNKLISYFFLGNRRVHLVELGDLVVRGVFQLDYLGSGRRCGTRNPENLTK